MLLDRAQIPNRVQSWFYSRLEELVPNDAEVRIKLNEATEALQKHITTKAAGHAFFEFDCCYGALLVQNELAAFSLGFELGRHPETLLGEMVEM